MKNWRIPTSVEEILKLQNLMNSQVFTRDIIQQIYSLMYIDTFESEIETNYKNKDCSYKNIKSLILYYIKELSMRFILTPHLFKEKVSKNALISFSMLAGDDLYNPTKELDNNFDDKMTKALVANMQKTRRLEIV